MRIIGGQLKGLHLTPSSNLPVRPTTDLAKEALFNILNSRFDFERLRVLDLFSGTGSIAMEFASRGVPEVIAIDHHFACIKYLKTMVDKHQLAAVHSKKMDVFKFLEQGTEQAFDLIFMDPPYDLPQLMDLPSKIIEQHMLTKEGCLILEHTSMKKLDQHPYFIERRKYGSSSFSFFTHKVLPLEMIQKINHNNENCSFPRVF